MKNRKQKMGKECGEKAKEQSPLTIFLLALRHANSEFCTAPQLDECLEQAS